MQVDKLANPCSYEVAHGNFWVGNSGLEFGICSEKIRGCVQITRDPTMVLHVFSCDCFCSFQSLGSPLQWCPNAFSFSHHLISK